MKARTLTVLRQLMQCGLIVAGAEGKEGRRGGAEEGRRGLGGGDMGRGRSRAGEGPGRRPGVTGLRRRKGWEVEDTN